MKNYIPIGFRSRLPNYPLSFNKTFLETTNKVKQKRLLTKMIPSKYEPTILKSKPVPIEADSPTKDLHDLFSGDLAEYTLGNIVGQGAYATVRRATMKSSSSVRAIKSYDKRRLREIHRRKNLRREIELLRQLDHPNLLRSYGATKTPKHIHLITEYISGVPLSSLLKTRLSRKLNETEAKAIFKQITNGVAYCHSKNISHRDLKLDNILLENGDKVKVIDFGFASCMHQGEKAKMFCGTPSYMAPEIVSKQEYAGPPADIWALGVVLYVMLTGTFPFRGSSDRELFRKIKCGVTVFPTVLSEKGRDLIMQMLSLSPESRLSAEEILLHEWLSDL